MPHQGLVVRKLAGEAGSDTRRAAPGDDRPFAGLQIEGDPPKEARVPTSFVIRGQSEGWIDVENPQMVIRPAGRSVRDENGKLARLPLDQTGQPHVFMHCDAITLKTVDGNVRYRVTHQPDKYVDGGKDTDKVTDEHYENGNTRVDWFYDLKLETS